VYNLTYLGTGYRDAYQSAQPGCGNGSGVCCNSTSYTFGNNRTTFLGFGIAPTNTSNLQYSLAVSGNGTYLSEVEFDMLDSGQETDTGGLTVIPSANGTQHQTAANLTGFNLLVPDGQPTAEGSKQRRPCIVHSACDHAWLIERHSSCRIHCAWTISRNELEFDWHDIRSMAELLQLPTASQLRQRTSTNSAAQSQLLC